MSISDPVAEVCTLPLAVWETETQNDHSKKKKKKKDGPWTRRNSGCMYLFQNSCQILHPSTSCPEARIREDPGSFTHNRPPELHQPFAVLQMPALLLAPLTEVSLHPCYGSAHASPPGLPPPAPDPRAPRVHITHTQHTQTSADLASPPTATTNRVCLLSLSGSQPSRSPLQGSSVSGMGFSHTSLDPQS